MKNNSGHNITLQEFLFLFFFTKPIKQRALQNLILIYDLFSRYNNIISVHKKLYNYKISRLKKIMYHLDIHV